jgi:hypothetical protein
MHPADAARKYYLKQSGEGVKFILFTKFFSEMAARLMLALYIKENGNERNYGKI